MIDTSPLAAEDFAIRHARALLTFRQPVWGWWFEHASNCGLAQDSACECGYVVWFAVGDRVLAIDANLAQVLVWLH